MDEHVLLAVEVLTRPAKIASKVQIHTILKD